MKSAKVVILGDLLYDCFTWADRLPRKGETVMGYANGFYSGGKGANQAVQAAKLEAEVYLIGKVGNDEQGHFLLRELQQYGVHTEYVFVDKKAATGTCCIHVDKEGDNAIIVAPLANMELTMQEVEHARPIIEQADVFMTQLLLDMDVTLQCLKIAKEAGVFTVLNPAPARELPNEFYECASIISPNETEAEYFSNCYRGEYENNIWQEKVAAYFREKGTNTLIMTMGSNGVYYNDGSENKNVPCFRVTPIDCTGAGDSFNAAFAVQYIRANEIEQSLIFASAAAALTVQNRGAQPAMPKLEQVEQFLENQKENK